MSSEAFGKVHDHLQSFVALQGPDVLLIEPSSQKASVPLFDASIDHETSLDPGTVGSPEATFTTALKVATPNTEHAGSVLLSRGRDLEIGMGEARYNVPCAASGAMADDHRGSRDSTPQGSKMLHADSSTQPLLVQERGSKTQLLQATTLDELWRVWSGDVKGVVDDTIIKSKDTLLAARILFLVTDALYLTTDVLAIHLGLLKPPLAQNATRLR